MMSKFKKNSPEWRFFADFYLFCEKYYTPENSGEYWQGFLNDSNEIVRKYEAENPKIGALARRMMLGFSDYLDDLSK